MRIRITLWFTLISFMLPAGILAQDVTKVGTTAGKFLAVPAGARGIGMGGAYVAVTDDPTAMYWNPAGITRMQSAGVSLDHTTWFEGVQFEYAGGVYPMGRYGTVGLNVQGFTTGEMEVTTVAEQEGTGEYFSAGSYAFGLTYARQLTENFAIGFNGKYIREQIWHSSASALALDVGVTYETPFRNIILGFSISNFGQKLQMRGEDLLSNVDLAPQIAGNNENLTAMLETDQFDLPLLMRIGVASNIIDTGTMRLTLAADALHPNDNTESLNIGGELALWKETVLLRGGLRSLAKADRQTEFALGGGLRYPILGQMELQLDYVYETHKYLGAIQKYSLGLLL